MLQGRITIFLTWPFITFLALLLINDCFLKAAYPGWITGKLSDFSGIAIICLLSLSFFSIHRFAIYAVISGFFFWWKSPLSDVFIEMINLNLPFQIGRVVDYTDLFSLGILPICHFISVNERAFSISNRTIRKATAGPIAISTLFAIMGTSMVPLKQQYTFRPMSVVFEDVFTDVSNVVETHGLICHRKAESVVTGYCDGDGLKVVFTLKNGSVTFDVLALPAGIFIFNASAEDRAEFIKSDLKEYFVKKRGEIEFVEKLSKNPYQ